MGARKGQLHPKRGPASGTGLANWDMTLQGALRHCTMCNVRPAYVGKDYCLRCIKDYPALEALHGA